MPRRLPFSGKRRTSRPRSRSTGSTGRGTICAPEYGRGKRGVVLAHGGQFKKESWDLQARYLTKSGFRVVAVDFRGYGCSKGPRDDDVLSALIKNHVLAAVCYLLSTSSRRVAVVGARPGGWATSAASIEAKKGEIDRIVTLGSLTSMTEPEKITVPLLVITTRNDANSSGQLLPAIRAAFEKVAGQKNWGS